MLWEAQLDEPRWVLFLPTLLQANAYDSPAKAFTSEEPNARGRVLGGSSTINAGFYSRADQDFYAKSASRL